MIIALWLALALVVGFGIGHLVCYFDCMRQVKRINALKVKPKRQRKPKVREGSPCIGFVAGDEEEGTVIM